MPPGTRSGAPILCYVTDRRSLPFPTSERENALLERIELAAAAGVDWIQIREKDLSGKACSALVSQAVERVRSASESRGGETPGSRRGPARILVNNRLDIAIAARASGAHFGENSLPPRAIGQIRRLLAAQAASAARNFSLGFSCHSLESARAAASSGASYVFFGPVFQTPSKAAFGRPQGLDRLAEVCAAICIPVIAIGGIHLQNAAACVQAGAAGIAAIRLFQDAPHLPATIAALRRSLHGI